MALLFPSKVKLFELMYFVVLKHGCNNNILYFIRMSEESTLTLLSFMTTIKNPAEIDSAKIQC